MTCFYMKRRFIDISHNPEDVLVKQFRFFYNRLYETEEKYNIGGM